MSFLLFSIIHTLANSGFRSWPLLPSRNDLGRRCAVSDHVKIQGPFLGAMRKGSIFNVVKSLNGELQPQF